MIPYSNEAQIRNNAMPDKYSGLDLSNIGIKPNTHPNQQKSSKRKANNHIIKDLVAVNIASSLLQISYNFEENGEHKTSILTDKSKKKKNSKAARLFLEGKVAIAKKAKEVMEIYHTDKVARKIKQKTRMRCVERVMENRNSLDLVALYLLDIYFNRLDKKKTEEPLIFFHVFEYSEVMFTIKELGISSEAEDRAEILAEEIALNLS